MTALRQFLTELRRRRVIRVLLMYVIAGWAIVQVAATMLPSLHVPAWSMTLVVVLVALGLPLAAILGWAYEVSDDGLKRTGPARHRGRHRRRTAGSVRAAGAGVSLPDSARVAGAVVHTIPPRLLTANRLGLA